MDLYWFEQTVAGVPPGDEWLSEDECGVLAGLRVPKRRADWRLGRWTAKRAIAALLGVDDLRGIEIRAAASGAPRAFVGSRPAGVAISISHSQGVGLCAIAEGAAIGCDLEAIEPRSAAFLADYFTDDEQAAVKACGSSDLLQTSLWSAKESALKALEYGLRADVRSLRVETQKYPDEQWAPITVSASDAVLPGFWRVADGIVRSIVIRRSDMP